MHTEPSGQSRIVVLGIDIETGYQVPLKVTDNALNVNITSPDPLPVVVVAPAQPFSVSVTEELAPPYTGLPSWNRLNSGSGLVSIYNGAELVYINEIDISSTSTGGAWLALYDQVVTNFVNTPAPLLVYYIPPGTARSISIGVPMRWPTASFDIYALAWGASPYPSLPYIPMVDGEMGVNIAVWQPPFTP